MLHSHICVYSLGVPFVLGEICLLITRKNGTPFVKNIVHEINFDRSFIETNTHKIYFEGKYNV